MARSYEEIIQELEGTVKQEFGLSNQSFWDLALSKDKGKHVEKIAGMVRVVQEANAKLDAQKQVMLEKEANRIIDKRARNDIGPLAEFVSSTASHPRPVTEEARRNVDAEIARRKQFNAERLKDQVHQVLRVGKHAELKVDPNIFNENRAHMMRMISGALQDHGTAKNQIQKTYRAVDGRIEQMAKELGSETPKETVTEAFKQAHRYNDAHRNERLSNAFKEGNHAYQKGQELQEAEWLLAEHKHQQRAQLKQELPRQFNAASDGQKDAEQFAHDQKHEQAAKTRREQKQRLERQLEKQPSRQAQKRVKSAQKQKQKRRQRQ